MIQLLTGSLVFQLLTVQFVCTSVSRGSRWKEEVDRREESGRRKREIKRIWKIRKDEKGPNKVDEEKVYEKPDVPSRSSMVFSSLATDLSENSARVSAFERLKTVRKTVQVIRNSSISLAQSLQIKSAQFTSFSLSLRLLISSS